MHNLDDHQIDEKLRAWTASGGLKGGSGGAVKGGCVTQSYREGYRQAMRDVEERMRYNEAMEVFAHKLAMDLECVLLSPSSWTERAFQTLDEYKKAKDELFKEMTE